MPTYKKLYMQVLYNCKNKSTVDAMSWDELCAYYHMMKKEMEAMNG
ncbi:MAG: hypothetical protein ACRC6E_07620 [Fusobacteriaceae bacterium]